jgi:hypothetical protein
VLKHCMRYIFVSGVFAVRAALLILILTCVVFAQNETTSASLRGFVTDSSGARVSGASVTLRSPEKGISRSFVTDSNGSFAFTLLSPGSYNLQIAMKGFKTFRDEGLVLEVGQSTTKDISLVVGAVGEQIIVSGETPLLQTGDANLSAEVTGKQVVDLPLDLRNVYSLASLNSSVNNAQESQKSGGGSSSSIADQDVSFLNFGGGFFGTTAFLLDGVWDTASDWGAVVYVPSVDSVQEFRIQTNSFTAQYGWSTGNVINVITKSGSDAFHGSAYLFYRNATLDANSFFNNRAGVPRPDFGRKQFGTSVGGPLYLPGLYRQRHKTFIWGIFEGLRQSTPGTFTGTVPTPGFASGDFSALLGTPTGNTDALGRPIVAGQIYNPYSTRKVTTGQVDPTTGLVATSTGFVRDPVPQNNISASINPVGAALTKFYPAATNPASFSNNFTAAAGAPGLSDEYTIRVDHNPTDNDRIYGRWSQKRESVTNSPAYYGANDPGGPGNVRPNNRFNFTLGYNHLFNATTNLSVNGGFSRWVEGSNTQGYPFKASSVGLPSFLDSSSPLFPVINVEGMSSLGPVQGNQGAAIRNVGSISADLTKVVGPHSLSFGFMEAWLQNNGKNLPGTTFQFDKGFTGAIDGSTQATDDATGFGLASLLVGAAANGSTANNFNAAITKKYFGYYVQDGWRVTPTLTVNLGLRFEYQLAPTERHDRQAYFDLAAPNPIGRSVGMNLPGTIIFNGDGQRRGLYNTAYDLAPRIGFAKSFTSKVVGRGGYGIFYPPQFYGGGPNPGYSQSTPYVATLDGFTPANTLSSPFPNGLRQPTGNSLGALQDVGFGTNAVPGDHRSPYVQMYSLGVQYAFTNSDVLKVSYVGNKGTHLLMGGVGNYTLSQLNPSYLPMGSALLNLVPNPFYGHITGSSCGLDQPTIQQGQLLKPFPQFCSVGEPQAPVGFSNYNALQADFDHRFKAGLNLFVSYTFSKFIDNVQGTNDWSYNGVSTVRNFYDLAAEKSVDAGDTPHSLVINYIYELPIGKGKAFGNGMGTAAKAVLGGWQLAGISSFKLGFPIGITGGGNSNLFGGTQKPDLVGDPNAVHKTIDHWFNTAAFAYPSPYTFGNVPRFFSNVRGPGYQRWDISIQKWWNFSETIRLQFRAEMFNAFNHANFYAPDECICDGSNFGKINSAFPARDVQFAGKLYW